MSKSEIPKEAPEYVYKALAKKFEAEAEREQEEARAQRLFAEITQLDLNEKRRREAERLATNDYNRVYRFTQAVSESSVQNLMNKLDVWRRLDPSEDITIVFTSPGGSVIDGMALWDYLSGLKDELHAHGAKLITETHGMAASMAGILLQAGDIRRMGKEAYVLIHQVQAAMLGDYGKLQDRMKWLEKIQSRVLDIFATRASAVTGESFAKTRRFFEKNWERTDWWIDSVEAAKIGLIDEVV